MQELASLVEGLLLVVQTAFEDDYRASLEQVDGVLILRTWRSCLAFYIPPLFPFSLFAVEECRFGSKRLRWRKTTIASTTMSMGLCELLSLCLGRRCVQPSVFSVWAWFVSFALFFLFILILFCCLAAHFRVLQLLFFRTQGVCSFLGVGLVDADSWLVRVLPAVRVLQGLEGLRCEADSVL